MGEEDRNQPRKFQEITEKGDEDIISVLPDCLLVEILSRLPSTKYAIRTGTLSKRWEHLWTLVPTLDRISALPDCLLVEILSRLPSTKHAIRTGTLSKRWEHLWTLVPTLVFRLTDYPRHHCIVNPDFALLVDKSLTQCRQLKLKKFLVYTKYNIRYESQFKNWILFAISCNVEKLNLNFEYTAMEADFRLDQSVFFINSSFTDLSLRGCILNPSGKISWKNLRSLCIWSQNFDEDLIVNILSGSPLLETLVLKYDYFYSWSICKRRVLCLPLLNQWPQLKKIKKLEVCSYDIQFESQLNRWILYAIRCNAKEINITFYSMGTRYEFEIDQILFKTSCFNELMLCKCRIDPVGAISWKNLRSLHISDGCLGEVLIENILSGSPVLETLELTYCFGYRRLDITSKSIKNLVLSGYKYWDHDNFDIEINAPDILSLTIQLHLTTTNILLVNVSSLVKANLDYSARPPLRYCSEIIPKEVEQEMLKEAIQNLCHVKEVKVGILCSKALTCLQAKGFVVPSNVKFDWFKGRTQGMA